MFSTVNRFMTLRHEVGVPTIAAINGVAVGAGLCLALTCDLRIASERSKMGLNFLKLGIHPGMGATHFLPLLCGVREGGVVGCLLLLLFLPFSEPFSTNNKGTNRSPHDVFWSNHRSR